MEWGLFLTYVGQGLIAATAVALGLLIIGGAVLEITKRHRDLE
jgi:hypothetical protein